MIIILLGPSYLVGCGVSHDELATESLLSPDVISRLEIQSTGAIAELGWAGFQVTWSEQGARIESEQVQFGLSVNRAAPPDFRAHPSNIELSGDGIEERWDVQSQGLEHSFIIAKPDYPVTRLAITVTGAEIEPVNPREVVLVADGLRIPYTGLKAFDSSKNELNAWFYIDGDQLVIEVISPKNPGPITIDPLLVLPEWNSTGGKASNYNGYSLASAGDVNGDGFDDVLVGSPYARRLQRQEGAASLYLGSSNGIGTSPVWTLRSGQASADLGQDVAGGQDLDGDGLAEVVVGVPRWDITSNEGAVQVFRGRSQGPRVVADWTVEGTTSGDALGSGVALVSDLSGDGLAELAVGAPGYDGTHSDEGTVAVYAGDIAGPRTVLWSWSPGQAGAEAGTVIESGDIDGDGLGDVVVGVEKYQGAHASEGGVFVFLGASNSGTPDWAYMGGQAYAGLGHAAGVGDVNGDGFEDLAAGAWLWDENNTNEGKVVLFYGGQLASTPDWTAYGEQASALLGASVSMVGDTDRDGFEELAVGAPYFDDGESEEGRVSLFRGSAYGLDESESWVFFSDQAGAYTGFSVSGGGDVNGDGCAELTVGSPWYDQGALNTGLVQVFYGHP